MAIVRSNTLIEGLSGAVGGLVFKNYGSMTVVTAWPNPPKTQSAQQQANRSKFKEATQWAKAMMLDPERKAYYKKKAKELQLPNAYTAAITDYMRKPQLTTSANADKSTNCAVSKKDFVLKAVRVALYDATGTPAVTRPVAVNRLGDFTFLLTEAERSNGAIITVHDTADRVVAIRVH